MNKQRKVKVRRWNLEDIPTIVEIQRMAYPNFAESDLCDERNYRLQIEAFPDGQILAEIGGKIVGYATSLIVQISDESPWYSFPRILNN